MSVGGPGVTRCGWAELVRFGCGIRGLGGLSVWLMASEPRSLDIEGCPEFLGCLRQQPGLVDAFSDVNVDGAQGVRSGGGAGGLSAARRGAQESAVQLGI